LIGGPAFLLAVNLGLSRGSTKPGTALIPLGIPKLVRFDKIRQQSPLAGIIILQRLRLRTAFRRAGSGCHCRLLLQSPDQVAGFHVEVSLLRPWRTPSPPLQQRSIPLPASTEVVCTDGWLSELHRPAEEGWPAVRAVRRLSSV